VAVVFYSTTGGVHALATAVSQGARDEGAEVRLRRVSELTPEPVAVRPVRRPRLEATETVATLDDLEWADGIAFGTPAYYGNVAAELKYFIDGTGGLWARGKLSTKVVTGFTATTQVHSGNESTLLALYQSMCHWGALLMPSGYTDESIYKAGGNPYGTSAFRRLKEEPSAESLAAARHQGRRLAWIGAAMRAALDVDLAAPGADGADDSDAGRGIRADQLS
jgi:NAD(P)H dehydrogenase (quinone)